MRASCPTCQQILPLPRPHCADCGHPQAAHSIKGNGPRQCANAVITAGRLSPCACQRRQDAITEVPA